MRLLSIAVMISLAAQAEEVVYKWKGPTNCTTPDVAAEWSSDDNWTPKGVPSSRDDVGMLVAADNDYFVKIGTPLTLARICGSDDSSARNYILSDSPVTVAYPQNGELFGFGYFYLPIVIDKASGVWSRGSHFCGDVTADVGPVFAFGGDVHFRYDRYATSSSDERHVPGIGSLRHYYAASHFYAPRGTAEVVELECAVTAGSSFVRRIAGASFLESICVGAPVTGAVHEGTFVRRVFNADWFELSAPAVDSSNVLQILAFQPETHVVVELASGHQEEPTVGLHANRYATSGVMDVEIGRFDFSGGDKTLQIGPDPSFLPGRIVVHDVALGYENTTVSLAGGHLVLSSASQGSESGFPASRLTASGDARVTVDGGVEARVLTLADISGQLVKDGSGTLTAGVGPGISGSICVESGRLRLTSTESGASSVATLIVRSGATVSVPAEGLSVGSLIAEEGAIIAGPGSLLISEAQDLSGIRFEEGGGVIVSGTAKYLWTQPLNPVPDGLVPAFWVDASKTNTMEIVHDADSGHAYVRRWNDVRGPEYNFAQTMSGDGSAKMPWLIFGKSAADGFTEDAREIDEGYGALAVRFPYDGVATTADNWQSIRSLTWDKPVYGIRAIFQVLDAGEGGGMYLGVTPRVSGHANDFLRDIDNARQAIFFSVGTDACRFGDFRINGESYDTSAAYPYEGYDRGTASRGRNLGEVLIPIVTSVRPVEINGLTYPAADSFDLNYSGAQRNGKKRICELLVFTNEVSEAQMREITEYLMRKWQHHQISFTPGMSDGQTLGIIQTGTDALVTVGASEGSEMALDGVSGSGTLVKLGAGTLVVRDFVYPNVSLSVAEGVLRLGSVDPQPPADAFLHLDAACTETISVNQYGVTAWADRRGEGYPVADGLSKESAMMAQIRADGLNGLPVVDFGTVRSTPDRSQACGLVLSAQTNCLQTLLAVIGSQNGGGVYLGDGGNGYDTGYGLLRGNDYIGQSKDSPFFMTGVAPKTIGNAYAAKAWLNGVPINPTADHPTGGYDTFVLRSIEPFGLGGISCANYDATDQGGQAIAEYVAYSRGLSDEEIRQVQAYFSKKWFDRETVNYRAAIVGCLEISSGALLDLVGGAPITVASFHVGAGGAVNGSVSLVADGELEVDVSSDGELEPLTLTGDLDMSGGGVVRLDGDLKRLGRGRHVLLSAAGGLKFGEWRVEERGVGTRRSYALVCTGTELCLDVIFPGMSVIVR